MFDSNHTWKILKEDRVIKRALTHFDKKITDMIQKDESISEFEVLKQYITLNHHRVTQMIEDMSKSDTHIMMFRDEKKLLLDIFQCYEHDLSESMKTILEKTGIKSFKFESVETELASVRNIIQRIKDHME